ncbi:MAG: hypothetical protein K2M04_04080 [Muribaculaceae bacterium]|nr:hypothetical protein [Muribaculaceae bacterium]
MNIDRTLNIYQAYSLAKISALNKLMVLAQYAQCEYIGKLENSLSNELRAINATNQQILENQINEAKRQEKIRYYRSLAHNIKECIDIICEQKDMSFKYFLLEIFREPINLCLEDAKVNLEEIGDKEFCSKWEKILQNNVDQVSSFRTQFNLSPFKTLLEQHDSYMIEEDELNKQSLNYRKEKMEIKAPVLETAKSLDSYQPKGCLLTMVVISILSCFFFTFGAIVNGFSDTSELVSVAVFLVLIPLSILLCLMIKARKKKKEYNSYLTNIDRVNNKRLQNYNDAIIYMDQILDKIEVNRNHLELTHPYSKAKTAINSLIPGWEGIIDKITSKLPTDKGESTNNNFDPLLAKIAKSAVKYGKISTNSIQLEFSLGYNRAKKIIEQLVNLGVVHKKSAYAPAEVIVDSTTLQNILEDNHIV